MTLSHDVADDISIDIESEQKLFVGKEEIATNAEPTAQVVEPIESINSADFGSDDSDGKITHDSNGNSPIESDDSILHTLANQDGKQNKVKPVVEEEITDQILLENYKSETSASAPKEIFERVSDGKGMDIELATINLEEDHDKVKEVKRHEHEELYSDIASLKSTDAILETATSELDVGKHDSETDSTSPVAQQPSEMELNPALAQFMSSCQEGNLPAVEELIKSKQIQPNDTFSDGITGLHWACINNRLTLVKFLLQNGADPNKLGGELVASPLHWACRNGLVYIVDCLLTYSDADPAIRDSQSYNCLHLAVHSSNITLVIYLLLSCCDANSMKKMYVDEPDGFNRTALHWAAYQGDTFTVNALLRFGADVSKMDNTLFIPIHWAFMKGYKVVLKTLLKAGSDIHFKNVQGKDTFEIAKDMNCVSTWTKVLTECDRDPKNNWAHRKRFMNPKVGKLITFFTPYVILPIVLNICSVSAGFGIPKLFLGFGIIAVAVFTLNKLVVPTYLIDDKAIQKSPIFAGIFSATAFWAIMVWTYAMLPITFLNHFFLNIFLGGCIGLFSWAFFKSMFINPGFVPTPADNSVILSQVKDLMAEGKFDTDHFCVNTFVRKPLRSKYSRHNNKLIARFDHYCPWVYNDIGVRNHKLFMTFVYALNLAIVFFTWLSIKYFDQLKDAYESDDEDSSIICALVGDDLCYGYKNHHFHYNLIMWCWLQYIWIVFLCLVQTFQILKGVTTWEFSNLNNKIQSSRFNHSTVPHDFGIDTAPAIQQQLPNGRETGYNTCMQLLGIDQFVLTLKLSITSFFAKSGSSTANETIRTVDIPTDYGFKQNWLDFWIIGEPNWRNVFYLPIKGENNLNGEVVDYYKLYEYPAKYATQVV